MGQRRGDLVDVELVEDAQDARGGRPRGRSSSLGPWWRSRPARVRSGLTRLATAAAAVGCLTLVVQQGAVAADEAALELLPGRSAPLDRPLTEVWRLGDSFPIGWFDGDLVVSGGVDSSTSRIDPATGIPRWSVPGTQWCSPLDPAAWSYLGSATLPTLAHTRLFCTGQTTYPDSTAADPVSATILLDVADGTTTPGPAVDGELLTLLPVGADLVVAAATADGHVHAERWSPDSRATVWRYTSADAVVDGGGFGVGAVNNVLEINGSRTVRVDLTTGQESADAQPLTAEADVVPPITSQWTLPDGSTVRGIAGASATYTRTAPDGTALTPLPGWPVPVGVDDGSGSGVVLVVTTDALLAAVDLATGRTLWSTDGIDAVAVLDRLAIVRGSGSISARDIRTGAVAWTDQLPTDLYTGTAVTDGHDVAYVTASGGLALRAVDVHSGAERARTPIKGYGGWLVGTAPDGTIILADYEGGLSALRP